VTTMGQQISHFEEGHGLIGGPPAFRASGPSPAGSKFFAGIGVFGVSYAL
jgi:hypothetical protein